MPCTYFEEFQYDFISSNAKQNNSGENLSTALSEYYKYLPFMTLTSVSIFILLVFRTQFINAIVSEMHISIS